MPHHLYSTELLVLGSLDEKSLKGKRFACVEGVKQKMAEALKASKSTSSNTVLSSRQNVLTGVLYQMESTLKVTEV